MSPQMPDPQSAPAHAPQPAPQSSPTPAAARIGRGRIVALVAIAAIALGLASAFAWAAGWLGGGRLTAPRMVDAIEANGPAHPGFRRAHSKGVCVAGVFRSSGRAAGLSSARVFRQPETPVLGRLSIGGGDPNGADASARVRSMALLLRSDDGAQWRMAMNNFPFFSVATPEGFQAQTLASRPDPATGKPDPARLAAFRARYPESRKFAAWAKEAPWPDSWANTRYNSVNAFRFVASDGRVRFVRWSMRPQAPFAPMDAQTRARADAGFLAKDLAQRLARAPLRWDLVLALAAAGDPVDDPSQPWPDDREQVVAGTLELREASPQAQGACRDVVFDPLVLPPGIRASDDLILAARSAAYARSFDRREHEIGYGRAPGATGGVR